jgi:hypothetical protein
MNIRKLRDSGIFLASSHRKVEMSLFLMEGMPRDQSGSLKEVTTKQSGVAVALWTLHS